MASIAVTLPILPKFRVKLEPITNQTPRRVKSTVKPVLVQDGAGVKLRRSIGSSALSDLDPFLLLDEFGSSDPKDYMHGFPTHPHRGMETVTIMLDGKFKHKDSKGNSGLLVPGAVQWMTAGRGILHSEMPGQTEGRIWGLQFWLNLPRVEKMKDPRYQDLKPEDIPHVETENGVKLRVVAGQVGDVKGAVDGISIRPTLLDIEVPAGQTFSHTVEDGHTLFTYGIEGTYKIGDMIVPPSELVIFDKKGTGFSVTAPPEHNSRILVASGAPIKEPIARYGPFVMNSHEEILQTIQDFKNGNF